eukprot:6211901-Pleurochrysis_carterae.AAC.2
MHACVHRRLARAPARRSAPPIVRARGAPPAQTTRRTAAEQPQQDALSIAALATAQSQQRGQSTARTWHAAARLRQCARSDRWMQMARVIPLLRSPPRSLEHDARVTRFAASERSARIRVDLPTPSSPTTTTCGESRGEEASSSTSPSSALSNSGSQLSLSASARREPHDGDSAQSGAGRLSQQE